MPKIKNVIFDVGNVLVQWRPYEVIGRVFKHLDSEQAQKEFYSLIKPTWLKLNLGTIKPAAAIDEFVNDYRLDRKKITQLIEEFKNHQIPIEGSIELLEKLKIANISLYAITDNTKAIIQHHIENSEFSKYFIEILCSADIGHMKPDAVIFYHLLEKHRLTASECVFIDDYAPNVRGAESIGMNVIHFEDTESCKLQLIGLGVEIE